MEEQREKRMGLTNSECLLYARHHARHCMYFMCANTLDSTKIWRDEYQSFQLTKEGNNVRKIRQWLQATQ